MRKICVGILGFSGSGKDEIAKSFVKRGAIQLGLADPAKRHMADLYGFSEQQLFGPSQFRNEGDLRYPKLKLQLWEGIKPNDLIGDWDNNAIYWWFEGRDYKNDSYIPLKLGNAKIFVKQGDPSYWLSPRETLQKYCELMNNLYENTWIRQGINTSIKLFQTIKHESDYDILLYKYSQIKGIEPYGHEIRLYTNTIMTCFSDFRHKHEINYLRKQASDIFIPVIIKVKRPGIDKPPYNHRSETEQATIGDFNFDFVIKNDGTLQDLDNQVDKIYQTIQGTGWKSLQRTV